MEPKIHGEMPGDGRDRTNASTSGDRLRRQTSVIADDLRELGRATKDAARGYYEQGQQGLVSYVHRKPLQAMLGAAGAGLLLGWFVSRRR